MTFDVAFALAPLIGGAAVLSAVLAAGLIRLTRTYRSPLMKILGREPMQWLGLLSAAVALFSAIVFPLSIEQQGALIAVVEVVLGIAGAFAVSAEKAAPFVAGLVKAILALALAFGAAISPEAQGSIMAFVAAGVAWYLRTQVTAQVPTVAVDEPQHAA